jgi:inosose dehydratase
VKPAMTPSTWQGWAEFSKCRFKLEEFLDDVAEAEFLGVELGGGARVLGSSVRCRRAVESRGLSVAAYESTVGYGPSPSGTEEFRAAVQFAGELGVGLLVVTGGFLPSPRRTTYAFDYDEFAASVGEAAEYARRNGITVAFHPHRGCIVETVVEMEQLLARLPQLHICADVAHLEASGEDALTFIRVFKKQIVHVHLKDYTWKLDGFVELGRGDGKLNVAKCVKELKRGGYDGWLTVELDKKHVGDAPRLPLESAKMCRRYLRRNCGV